MKCFIQETDIVIFLYYWYHLSAVWRMDLTIGKEKEIGGSYRSIF